MDPASIVLKNEHLEDKADTGDALRQRCEALYVVMRESGDVWVKTVVHFFAKDDAWSFEVDFTYPENAAPISSASYPSLRGAPSRRWWAFWN